MLQKGYCIPQTLSMFCSYFPSNFSLSHVIFFPLLLLLILPCFLWFSVVFVVLLCLELQMPCNTASPLSCFCFPNPCSCSQVKSRRDESPVVVNWEARGKAGNPTEDCENLRMNVFHGEHNLKTYLKTVTRETEGENSPLVSVPPGILAPLRPLPLRLR